MPAPSDKLLTSIVTGIHQKFNEHATPAIVEKYLRYFKEGYDGYGVPHEIYEEIFQTTLEKYGDSFSLEGILALADRLMQSPKYENGSLAIRLTLEFRKQFTVATFNRVTAWLDGGIRNWAHSDYVSGDLYSLFFMKGLVKPSDIAHWCKSESRWRRRALPVTLLLYLKKKSFTKESTPYLEKVKVTDLLPLVEPLMMDKERVVHQGVGWFLREAWKQNPKPVERILTKWKDKSPRLIFQYATEKMTKEQKEKYRKYK